MYDRIKVEYEYHRSELLREILKSVRIDPEHDDDVIGFLDGWRVRYANGLLHVSGSLLKSSMPNELGNPSLDALRQAYESLKNRLHIPEDAGGTVRYLEVGWNIIVERPVIEYLSFLRPVGRYQYSSINMSNGNGAYLSNEHRVIVMYDKIMERRKKRDQVYQKYQGIHMLRVESRFKRSTNAWLRSFLKRDSVSMEELFRQENAQMLMDYVQSEIQYILPVIKSDNAEWTTPRELIRLLAGRAVQLDGGVDVAVRRIDLHRRTGRIRARVAREARRSVYDAYDRYRGIDKADLREEILSSINKIAKKSLTDPG